MDNSNQELGKSIMEQSGSSDVETIANSLSGINFVLQNFTKELFGENGSRKAIEVRIDGSDVASSSTVIAPPLEIINNSENDTAEPKDNWVGPTMEILPFSKNPQGVIRILNPFIGEFLFLEHSFGSIKYDNLPEKNDTVKQRQYKIIKSLCGLEQMYEELVSNNLINDPREAREVVDSTNSSFSTRINTLFAKLNEQVDNINESRESIPLADRVASSFEDIHFHDYALKPETLKAFCNEVETHYNTLIKESKEALEKGVVTFEQLLRCMSTQGRLIGLKHGDKGEDIIGVKTHSASRKTTMFGNIYLACVVTVWNFDGQRVGNSYEHVYFDHWEGTKTLDELGIYLLETNPGLVNNLLARGKKYLEICKVPTYLQNTGTMNVPGMWGDTIKLRATGRAMIDRSGLTNFKPNYSKFYGGSTDFSDRNSLLPTSKDITDEMLVMFPPVMYGFSFVSKAWGEFRVDSLSSIKFKEDAFDKLQLPLNDKKLLMALVENVSTDNSDIIGGKGGGFIGLLAGNPGVGKTLTAETMAEKLQKPLYMVNVGELGTDAEALERSLSTILHIASSWKAILLIDEADIFLEERSDLDIERNAMVAVFLRLLEYYQGVMFLTTNRAKKLDPAFFSRIHMALHYLPLAEEARTNIWNNLLSIRGITGIDVASLAKIDINGRQIKNCVGNAVALSKQDNIPVNQSHFDIAIDTINKFEEVLKTEELSEITKH